MLIVCQSYRAKDDCLSLEELRTIPRMLISQYCYDRLDEIQKHINRVSHRMTI